MLVLTRSKDEGISIGDGPNRVIVTVVSVQGGRVKIGIEASPEIEIVRSELCSISTRSHRG